MDVTSVSHPVPVAVPELPSATWLTDDREWIQTVKKINASNLLGDDREMTFALDRASRRPVVRIIDRKTHEVIQQIPPEYLLEIENGLRQAMARMNGGQPPDKGE